MVSRIDPYQLIYTLKSFRTLLLYPLSPVFVLFCNVVSISHEEDFLLLQEITQGLSIFANRSRPVGRLHSLCATLVDICTPLVALKNNISRTGPGLTPLLNTAIPLEASSTSENSSKPSSFNPNQRTSYSTSFNQPYTLANVTMPLEMQMTMPQDLSSIPPMPSLWNEDLMWRVFESQPSFDWFETGDTHIPNTLGLL
jgi:hypothetical protein